LEKFKLPGTDQIPSPAYKTAKQLIKQIIVMKLVQCKKLTLLD
jgi:hypothetical protein